ncbi:MAG: hypothetical protein U9R48_06020 [Chloroflexota bacterium]|nr:hypothetical protein [Chloroflexota bacterium]
MNRKAKIYTAFPSSGLFGSTQTYPLHHPDEKVLSNEEILNEIAQRCEDVEFVGTTAVESPEYTVANVQAQSQSLDGVLYFGSLPSELTELDLPIVAVYPLWGQWQQPFESYGGRVLTATLPVIPDASPATFSSRLETIAEKIRLLQVATNLKALRILCITDEPVLGLYEPTAYQTAKEGRETYEKKYLENLAALGAEIIVRPQDEMIARMEAASEAEASEVAGNWIAGAEAVRGTNEAQVKQSARLYLAMKEMLALYDANAITTEGYGVFMYHEGGTIPSQGLPSSQFCTDGVVATSETLIDSLLTQQLGLWMTGSTGFNGDYIVDTDNDKAYIGHCECPLNPYGDERRAPYVVRNLPQWPEDEQEKGGACVQVNLPVNEQVTVAKVSVHDKAMVLFSGTAVDGESLFPGWEDILCRTKLAIDVDAKKLFEHLDWQTFGNHRVAFYGEHKQAFMDLATLLGFGVVEANK